ncbi:MAG: succinylglutamate desuccinylase/aspartoacylase family protein [Fretibacterium sp.]|uniref:succinylglutamate desuccinylase/aspartoacylase domain-containing protein n=1 Tax=Fretibacterium sp. OH1220_COT-178 TaxID=2491047 RepID=UPI000F5DF992|nr:succinylglutamate desuccinylase/aspartoacylase family protein [Fretibacterium sp. OH1220_COT-178]MDO4785653.1 succinylglutamate desuccinylase/aspartoacylase family protein [Fretibacterium sp.]RRD64702.1 succinylglutamate desuccinylase [Fretibacterium sp. OH1220_COT-178]
MEHRFRGNALTAALLLAAAAFVGTLAARSFMSMWADDAVFPAPGFEHHRLSEWEPSLAGSPGDTDVYVQAGPKPGGTVLILGGTHPNEPASHVAAVLCLERARVTAGRLIVVPFANRSAFTHNSPQDAAPQRFRLEQEGGGARVFRFGSRATNPIHQWPDPDIYIHHPSGQRLDGSSRSNLNRGYPGRLDDGLTQRVSRAILELIRREKADLAFDLHEASPEYPVVNAMVAHERAMELAATASLELDFEGIPMRIEPSPVNLRGLSHREWGDAVEGTLAILMESGNPSQGRLRGRTDEALVLTGRDKAYARASRLGRLFIPYTEDQPLALRVARHVTALRVCMGLLGDVLGPEKAVRVEGLPDYADILDRGVGPFLARDPGAEPAR